MMCFFVVCLLVFSIGSLQPLEVNADDDPMPTEESSLKEMTTAPPLPPRKETLGNPPSPLSDRENNEIPTPKPELPYWKPVGTGSSPRKPTSPSSQNPVPVPQSPEHPTPEPPGSTLSGRKPKGPLPPPPPPPPEDPQTPQIPTPKPSKPKPPLSAENEVTDTQKPSSNFKKPWNKLFSTRKPSLSSENEIDQTHKPSPPFWKPLTNLFPTRKPTGPLSPAPPSIPQTPKIPTPKPPFSAENEVTNTHKPSTPFWKPFTDLFPTRKPKGPRPTESNPTGSPNDQVCVEEWTTKKSYLKKVCPCCF